LPSPRLLSTSLTISASHIFLSLWDQGLNHLLTSSGAVLRDLMFVLSDLAAVVVFVYFLRPRLRRPAARGRLLLSIITLSASYLVLKRLAGYDIDIS
jgi:phosphoglycerate-specific signal transduction histidine kinase